MIRQRKAFTLIEVLIVIAVISVLATLITMGVRHIGALGREKSTRVTLENLKGMIGEKETAGGLSAVNLVYQPTIWTVTPDQIIAPGDVKPGGADRNPKPFVAGKPQDQDVIGATQMVMSLLKAVPINARGLADLPGNQIMAEALTNGINVPVLLDAWGNPIIYVPRVNPAVAGSGGMVGVATTGDNGKPAYITVRSPDGRGFWASAGPDGVFSILPGPNGVAGPPPTPDADDIAGGDDNVYSFEN